ncbi:MAG TPA: hypothetical protein VFE60_17605 [Roseiarcus sp.]|jgi:hypothetical protein|nr:hypothetical protein [Roseiarcus sp.]
MIRFAVIAALALTVAPAQAETLRCNDWNGYRVCDDGHGYRSFEQTYRGDMTIGSDNRGRSWTGLDDRRGGTIWTTVKPGLEDR